MKQGPELALNQTIFLPSCTPQFCWALQLLLFNTKGEEDELLRSLHKQHSNSTHLVHIIQTSFCFAGKKTLLFHFYFFFLNRLLLYGRGLDLNSQFSSAGRANMYHHARHEKTELEADYTISYQCSINQVTFLFYQIVRVELLNFLDSSVI